MSGWRPIETAPKYEGNTWDQPRVRLCCGDVEYHGRWNPNNFAKTPRPYWDIEGWQAGRSRACQPTHWMPVAGPPAQADELADFIAKNEARIGTGAEAVAYALTIDDHFDLRQFLSDWQAGVVATADEYSDYQQWLEERRK